MCRSADSSTRWAWLWRARFPCCKLRAKNDEGYLWAPATQGCQLQCLEGPCAKTSCDTMKLVSRCSCSHCRHWHCRMYLWHTLRRAAAHLQSKAAASSHHSNSSRLRRWLSSSLLSLLSIFSRNDGTEKGPPYLTSWLTSWLRELRVESRSLLRWNARHDTVRSPMPERCATANSLPVALLLFWTHRCDSCAFLILLQCKIRRPFLQNLKRDLATNTGQESPHRQTGSKNENTLETRNIDNSQVAPNTGVSSWWFKMHCQT